MMYTSLFLISIMTGFVVQGNIYCQTDSNDLPWASCLFMWQLCLCRFVNLLLSHMSMEELREEACDCLFEIVNKGMDPVDKTKLVESLCQVLQSAGFFNIEQVCEYIIVLETVHLVKNPFQELVLFCWCI